MIALLQRVTQASVDVEQAEIAHISQGLLVLVAIQARDTPVEAQRLLDKILAYRVFEDDAGKMNLSLQDIAGGLLLVPQFTLAADTKKGLRPSFSSAAKPEHGQVLFENLCQKAQQQYHAVEQGQFGADMQVSLINDGPATFWLQVEAST